MRLSNNFIKIILILSFSLAYPCTTKVSEWTMLNFAPAFYDLVYFTNKKLDDKTVQKHKNIKQSFKEFNLKFSEIEFNHIKNENEKKLFEKVKNESIPLYALFYKGEIFSQFTSTDDIFHLLRSPLLAKIADELKNGKLCVLLHLNQSTENENNNSVDVWDEYLSTSILKDIIPVIKLNAKNDQERLFINILLNVESDLVYLNEPMLFGIFGRFRILEPLVGRGITKENINYLVQFLSADCSCVIKTQMPGIDMLYYNKWKDVKPALLNQIITE